MDCTNLKLQLAVAVICLFYLTSKYDEFALMVEADFDKGRYVEMIQNRSTIPAPSFPTNKGVPEDERINPKD